MVLLERYIEIQLTRVLLHAEQAKVFNRLVRGEGSLYLLRPVLAKIF